MILKVILMVLESWVFMSEEIDGLKIAEKSGTIVWNMYFVDNGILFGGHRKLMHPFLVVDEVNGNLFGFICTHSKIVKNETLIEIDNLCSKDLDQSTKLRRKTYMNLRAKFTYEHNDKQFIKLNDLKNKVNDEAFTNEEKSRILKIINSREEIIYKYQEFIRINKKTP